MLPALIGAECGLNRPAENESAPHAWLLRSVNDFRHETPPVPVLSRASVCPLVHQSARCQRLRPPLSAIAVRPSGQLIRGDDQDVLEPRDLTDRSGVSLVLTHARKILELMALM